MKGGWSSRFQSKVKGAGQRCIRWGEVSESFASGLWDECRALNIVGTGGKIIPKILKTRGEDVSVGDRR